MRRNKRGAQRRLSLWLRTTGAIYAAGGAGFLLRPGDAPAALGLLGGKRLQPEEPGVYHALAAAYMVTIAALALRAADDPDARAALVPPLLVAKAASSLALLRRYRATRARGYAVGAGLDATILVITALLVEETR